MRDNGGQIAGPMNCRTAYMTFLFLGDLARRMVGADHRSLSRNA